MNASREVMLIDREVPDRGVLRTGARAGIAVLELPETLASVLAGVARSLTASAAETLHIVAHGAPGRLRLGGTWVDADALARHAAILGRIGRCLGPDAEIRLYACETGRGKAGRRFLARLAALTGARVIAASRPLGRTAAGSAWRLDVGGAVAAALAPIAAETQLAYGHALEALTGTSANDSLAGGGDADAITGLDGDDTLVGGNGDDTLSGGGGNDTLIGGAGNDSLSGGAGNDLISVGDGADFVVGGDGADTVTGTAAELNGDTVSGLNADDVIVVEGTNLLSLSGSAVGSSIDLGGGNTLTLADVADNLQFTGALSVDDTTTLTLVSVATSSTAGNDSLVGGDASNNISGLDGDDTILGLGGNDNLTGGPGNDLMSGGAGNDNMFGDDGDDSLSGGPGNDQIWGGAGADQLAGGDGNDAVRYDVGGSAGVNVDLAAGSVAGGHAEGDTISGFEDVYGSHQADTLAGDAGANFLDGGGGDDLISGGDGNDVLFGGDGSDSLFGGDGNDQVDGSGNQFSADSVTGDLLDGGNGDDTLVYFRLEGPVSVDLAAGTASGGQAEGDTITGFENVYGSTGDDSLAGDAGSNYLGGNEGDDRLSGRAGSDFLDGGDGNDLLSGGDGDDFLNGRSGNDTLVGGAGNDLHYGTVADLNGDVISGIAAGDSILVLGVDLTSLDGTTVGATVDLGDGNSLGLAGIDGSLTFSATLSNGNTTLALVAEGGGGGTTTGTEGADSLTGTDGSDSIAGLGGDDGIYGLDGDDLLSGGSGNDFLRGDGGADTLYGGDGNDDIDGGSGADLIYGGSGFDTISYDFVTSDGVSIDLSTQSVSGGNADGDTIVGFEAAVGSVADDTISGDGNDNELRGSAGDDVLSGGGGNDTLFGGTGIDSLHGGDGNDLLNGSGQISPADTITADRIDGGAGDDTLVYGPEAVSVNLATSEVSGGQAEGDTISGIENVFGGDGDDTLAGDDGFNILAGRGGSDILSGAGGNDVLDGGNGNDFADGGDGNDQLFGGDGADTLRGGDGSDFLLGGTGADLLQGGSGADIFSGSASEMDGDTISGVGAGDIIVVTGADLSALDGTNVGSTIDLGSGRTLNLVGVDSGLRFSAALFGTDTTLTVNAASGGGGTTGSAGNDTLTGTSGNDTVLALGGDDWVFGRSGDDLLSGGDGNDQLFGDQGDDTLSGGSGFDGLSGGAGNDLLVGGASNSDAANYLNDGAGVLVNLATGLATDGTGGTDSLSGIEQVWGSAHADTLIGDSGDNVMQGNAGSDSLVGGDGFDRLDFFNASTGIQVDLETGIVSDGQGGTDTVSGFEAVNGSGQADSILGSGAAENFEGNEGADTISGRGGDDFLRGDRFGSSDGSDDVLDGGAGNDFLNGSAGSDSLTGGTGNDGFGGAAAELDGDFITDFNANDAGEDDFVQIQGDILSASDVSLANDGSTTTVTVANTSAGTISFFVAGVFSAVSVSDDGSNSYLRLAGDASLVGTSGNDTLSGGGGGDTLVGLAGDDLLLGLGGDDLLSGGSGDDTLNGDDFSPSATDGADTLIGGDGNDRLVPGGGADSVDGGAGFADYVTYESQSNGLAATLTSGGGLVTDDGSGSEDSLAGIESFNAGQGNDSISTDGTVNIFARAGDDAITVTGGNPFINLGSGNDTLTITGGSAFVSFETLFDGAGNATQGVAVDLQAGTATDGWGGTDVLSGTIDGLVGSSLNDTITGRGDSPFEFFRASDGSDSYDLGGGGDSAFDILSYAQSFGSYTGGALSATTTGANEITIVSGTGTDTVSNTPSGGFRLVMTENADAFAIDTPLGTFNGGTEGYIEVDPWAGDDTIAGSGDPSQFLRLSFGNTATSAVNIDLDSGGTYVVGGTTYTLTLSDIRQVQTRAVTSNDTLIGNDADNQFRPGGGNDSIVGGGGSDELRYSNAFSGVAIDLTLGSGQVTSDGFGGIDTIYGIERFRLSSHADSFIGSGEADRARGDGGDDTLDGRGADDSLSGGSGNDLLLGGAGNDALSGGDGDDTLSGGSGDDTFRASGGSDTYDLGGGTDFDEIDYSGQSAPIAVDLSSGTGTVTKTAGGTDTVTGFGSNGVSFRGTSGADSFVGGPDPFDFQRFQGLAGADSIAAGPSGPFLEIDHSQDAAFGGTGAITVDLEAGTVIDGFGDTDSVSGVLSVRATGLADSIAGSTTGSFERYRGMAGNDTIDGATTAFAREVDYSRDEFAGGTQGVVVDLSAGTATDGFGDTDTLLNINRARGTSLADTLTGSDLANRLRGGGGNDVLAGRGGDDTLSGGDGADSLSGGDGADTLLGGSGADLLDGGAGNDVFSGSLAELNGDQIAGFAVGDTIRISDAGLAASQVSLSTAGGNTTLSLDSDGDGNADAQITLTGIVSSVQVVSSGGSTDIRLNTSPVASADTSFAIEDGGAQVIRASELLANDSDADGDPLLITSVAMASGQETSGTVALNPVGNIVFTPAANFSGTTAFTYTVVDGKGGSASATVQVEVVDTNDNPVAVNDTLPAIAEDTPATIQVATLLGNDSDADGDPISVTLVGNELGGTAVLDTGAGTVTFTPDLNHVGPAGFDYVVSDGNGGFAIAEARFDVQAVNDARVAGDVLGWGVAGVATVVQASKLLQNDSDEEGDAISIQSVSGDLISADGNATVGSVSFDSTAGTVTVTPDAAFFGQARFDYVVSDGTGSDTGTVTTFVLQAISGGAGNDVLAPDDTSVPSNFVPGIGDDSIVGGDAQDKFTFDNTDPDSLGFDGNDTLDGGAGGAILSVAGTTITAAQFDNISNVTAIDLPADDSHSVTVPETYFSSGRALNGTLTVDGSGAQSAGNTVTVDASAVQTGTLRIIGGGQADSLVGGALADTVTGGGGSDRISGLDGADILSGGSGDDTLSGGGGADSLTGGTGNDVLVGAGGANLLNGGAGNDTLDASGSSDGNTLLGGAGNDAATGGSGDDLINAGSGDDLALGGSGADTLSGAAGSDSLSGGAGADRLVGAGGNDALFGGDGSDTLSGGFGNDLLNGGAEADTLSGGNGVDTLTGAVGDDLLYGNDGNDVASGGDGADTIYGGGGDDLLYGNQQSDLLVGGVGNDTLYGGSDGDVMSGGAGLDVLYGGVGNDTFHTGDGADVIVLASGGGADSVAAGGFTDGVDRIDVSGLGVTGLSGLTIADGGGGATVTAGNTSLFVAGASAASFGAGDFVFQASQNSAPTVVADTASTVGGTAVTINVATLLANDSDGDGDSLVVTQVGGASGGTVSYDQAAGTVTFTPTIPSGNGGFTYTVSDGQEATTGTVSVTIAPAPGSGGGGGGSGGGGSGGGGSGGDSGGGTVTVSPLAPTVSSQVSGLATASLPFGSSLTSNGPGAPQSTTEAGPEMTSRIAAASGDVATRALVTSHFDSFLALRPAGTLLDVRTLTLTGSGSGILEPIVVSGTTDHTASQQEAFILDVRSLPAGSTLQLDNIEFASIIGSATVIGGAGDNHVVGDASSQFISLGVGNDTLIGGDGNDTVGSGAGTDLLYGGAGLDNVLGGADGDILYGNQGGDVLYGNQAEDTMFGGQDADTMFGGQDADIVYGNLAADVVYGNKAADILYGGQDADTLYGGQGDDVVFGNLGNDVLYGNLGADTLRGGGGDDLLIGGGGADLFEIRSGGGSDRIADFDGDAGDRLALDVAVSGSSITTTADGSTVIDLGNGETVTLTGVSGFDVAWLL